MPLFNSKKNNLREKEPISYEKTYKTSFEKKYQDVIYTNNENIPLVINLDNYFTNEQISINTKELILTTFGCAGECQNQLYKEKLIKKIQTNYIFNLLLGNNFSSTDKLDQYNLQPQAVGNKFICFAVPGDKDNIEKQINYTYSDKFRLFGFQMPFRYYALFHKKMNFIIFMLDSYLFPWDMEQQKWLNNCMNHFKNINCKILALHHPLVSTTYYKSVVEDIGGEINQFLKKEKLNFDLILAAHDKHLEFNKTEDGTLQCISGSLGAESTNGRRKQKKLKKDLDFLEKLYLNKNNFYGYNGYAEINIKKENEETNVTVSLKNLNLKQDDLLGALTLSSKTDERGKFFTNKLALLYDIIFSDEIWAEKTQGKALPGGIVDMRICLNGENNRRNILRYFFGDLKSTLDLKNKSKDTILAEKSGLIKTKKDNLIQIATDRIAKNTIFTRIARDEETTKFYQNVKDYLKENINEQYDSQNKSAAYKKLHEKYKERNTILATIKTTTNFFSGNLLIAKIKQKLEPETFDIFRDLLDIKKAKKMESGNTYVLADADGSAPRIILLAIHSGHMELEEISIENFGYVLNQEAKAIKAKNEGDEEIYRAFLENAEVDAKIASIVRNAKYKKSTKKLVYIGDIIFDRFTMNVQTNIELIEKLSAVNAVFIKGNHDSFEVLEYAIKPADIKNPEIHLTQSGLARQYGCGSFGFIENLDSNLEKLKKLSEDKILLHSILIENTFFSHNGIAFIPKKKYEDSKLFENFLAGCNLKQPEEQSAIKEIGCIGDKNNKKFLFLTVCGVIAVDNLQELVDSMNKHKPMTRAFTKFRPNNSFQLGWNPLGSPENLQNHFVSGTPDASDMPDEFQMYLFINGHEGMKRNIGNIITLNSYITFDYFDGFNDNSLKLNPIVAADNKVWENSIHRNYPVATIIDTSYPEGGAYFEGIRTLFEDSVSEFKDSVKLGFEHMKKFDKKNPLLKTEIINYFSTLENDLIGKNLGKRMIQYNSIFFIGFIMRLVGEKVINKQNNPEEDYTLNCMKFIENLKIKNLDMLISDLNSKFNEIPPPASEYSGIPETDFNRPLFNLVSSYIGCKTSILTAMKEVPKNLSSPIKKTMNIDEDLTTNTKFLTFIKKTISKKNDTKSFSEFNQFKFFLFCLMPHQKRIQKIKDTVSEILTQRENPLPTSNSNSAQSENKSKSSSMTSRMKGFFGSQK